MSDRLRSALARIPRKPVLFAAMAALVCLVGLVQSWSLALAILNLCLISAIMTLGVNIQWGYAGLFNAGVMGFAALGGLAGVLVSMPPVTAAWHAGGGGVLVALALAALTVVAVLFVRRRLGKPWYRRLAVALLLIGGALAARAVFTPAVQAIEAVDPTTTGYLGGLGLPIVLSWLVGGAFAAAAAWVCRISLSLRSDYLAIATLGISEIIVAFLKYEEWLTRGVKNVYGLPRPVPYEIDLQNAAWFQEWAAALGVSHVDLSSVVVKLCFAGLFLIVLVILTWLSETALRSPWGRMMRAIRDNETAAGAMGKNVTARHLQVFVLGSAVIGIAGAMLTTLDGQFTPASYQPMRFTFLIWVMVIVGGSGNNWGAVLGGFLIWYVWVQAEPVGLHLIELVTAPLSPESPLKAHLLSTAAHMRPVVMGLVLLLVLRFAPRGLIPEERR